MAEKEIPQQTPVPQEYIVPLAGIFKVLGDPTRLRILQALMGGECCVSDLAVSHQLRVLRDAALVQYRRQGKTVYYSLADEHVYTLLEVGLEHVAE